MECMMQGTKMKKRQVNLKIDPALDRFVRNLAENRETSQIAIYEEALEFFQARARIEKHVESSLTTNMRRFGDDFAAFSSWCDANKKLSPFGGQPINKFDPDRVYTFDSYVNAETFALLELWALEKTPEAKEAVMRLRVKPTEFWLPPSSLVDQGDLFDGLTKDEAEAIKAEQRAEVA